MYRWCSKAAYLFVSSNLLRVTNTRLFSGRIVLAASAFQLQAIRPSARSSAVVRLFASGSAAATTGMSPLLQNEKIRHISEDLLPKWMLPGRTRVLNNIDPQANASTRTAGCAGSVVYWMQRDVRSVDNWALLMAAHFADAYKLELRVIYVLPPPPPEDSSGNGSTTRIPSLIDLPMTERHGKFLLGGLECVHTELAARKIPLHVVLPKSHEVVGQTVCQTLTELQCKTVVCDFNPLRHVREWVELQAAPILGDADIPFYQVDAHNVVPVWIASDKREYAARTIRTKIQKLYGDYLQKFPKWKEFTLTSNTSTSADLQLPDFKRNLYEDFLKMDKSVGELEWAKPGTDAALQQAEFFFSNGLRKYVASRNDPTERNVCSTLSPWINHGHVSFQRLAMAVKKLNKHAEGTASFIEEGIVRRELSDNFVYYAPNDYDKLSAAYDWAKETLQTHATDPREYVYSMEEFESGLTHDDLWNAAQLQAVRDGKMHGFLRMYWAKKILEWTPSPEVALETALYLNDKFNIDGRDPNGFVGVGWSIMGIHDQGWKEREVFGKIRFMNYAGCKRKFKVAQFVALYEGAAENAVKAANKHSGGSSAKRSITPSVGGKKKKAKAK